MQIITLSGFGEFYENEEGLKELQACAKKHSVAFYPTYYDHELKGDAQAIENITMELWSMPRSNWTENALFETSI